MKTKMNTAGRFIALLVIPALFQCSAGLKNVSREPSQPEDIQGLPILKGPAAYFTIGRDYYNNGRSETALPYLQKAVQLDPQDARYRLFVGLVKKELEGFEAAEKDIDMALDQKQDLTAYMEKIRNYYKDYGVHCLNAGMTQKAVVCFNKVVALLPDDGEIRQYLAIVYLELARECTNGSCPAIRNHKQYGKVFDMLLD